MPLTNVDRLEAMLAAVGSRDIAPLSPAERQRLAGECRRVADLAEPKSGVLVDLKGGRQE